MAEKKTQIKIFNGVDYDILYPKTQIELVAGLTEALAAKVPTVEGKGLSTNDYTTEDQTKLTGIEGGAQVNTVTSVAGKTGVVTLGKADVGLTNVEDKSSETIRSEITSANVSAALGFTPENAANKDVANGYAGLDVNGKIAVAQLPSGETATVHIVADATARAAIVSPKTADRCFETSTGDTYIYDGLVWIIQADADWANVNLTWSNIIDKPLTFTPSDHTHVAADVTESIDKQFVTTDQKNKLDSLTKVTVAAVAPATPSTGDMWFEELV